MAFNDNQTLGVTLNKEGAEKVAKEARGYMCTPEASIQNPILTLAPHELVGTVARLRPFSGQLGTMTSHPFPDSHNAGNFAHFLLGASHDYATTEDELHHPPDVHRE